MTLTASFITDFNTGECDQQRRFVVTPIEELGAC
jgi:hypothetical protein